MSNYDWRRWLDKAAGRIDAALVDVGAALVYLSARIEEFIRALNGSRFGNAGNLPEIRWIY
ncbi:MAG TPA: hypothetical protein VL053_17700 [Arachidicoccus sp.]|nr:hypothetical protein [Arachidicoccus sp.]